MTDAAMEAAAEALAAYRGGPAWVHRHEAAHAVAAARPIIEAELRERIAAEIEAEESALFGSPEDHYQRGWSQMRGKAARIARGGTS